MTADGECFDEGELLEGQIATDMELAGWNNELRPHAAVGVDAEDLEFFAAVRSAAAAGVAGRVVDVGFDGAAVTGFDVGHTVADRQDFDAEFVAENARVRHKRHLAEVSADVGAADADAMDADEGFAGAGRWRLGEVDGSEGFGGFEEESVHRRLLEGKD